MNVTVDYHDRPVVVVSEDEWAILKRASDHGWVEIVGAADGYSAPIEESSPAAEILNRICQAVIDSPLSTDEDRALAVRGTCYAMITSPSRWDEEKHWWANSAPGIPHSVGGHFYRAYTADRRYSFAG